MSKENFFGVLITIVIMLLVLVIITGSLSNVDSLGKTDEAMEQSMGLADTFKVPYTLCGDGRMSGGYQRTIDTAGEATVFFRELSGTFDCSLEGTGEGECIIYGLYRREWCADGGFLCGNGNGENIGTYQFTVDSGEPELALDFTPECVDNVNVQGCCVNPKKGDGRDWLCDWWIYEWTYYGDKGFLNITVGNGESVDVWSRFADKWEGGAVEDPHNCSYGGDMYQFHKESYKYKNGELAVRYVKCCPNGYTWNDNYKTCCYDEACTNYLCRYPAFFMFGTCWMVSEPGESCEQACLRTGKTCSLEALENAISEGLEDNCDLHAEAGYACANCNEATGSENTLAPYFDPPGDCYYYSEAEAAANPFDCGTSDPGLNRICPCKLTGKTGEDYKCDHLVHEPGTCMDEDGGLVWDVAACVINDSYSWRDQCHDPGTGASVPESNTLREHFCGSGDVIGTQLHSCACRDGTCV